MIISFPQCIRRSEAATLTIVRLTSDFGTLKLPLNNALGFDFGRDSLDSGERDWDWDDWDWDWGWTGVGTGVGTETEAGTEAGPAGGGTSMPLTIASTTILLLLKYIHLPSLHRPNVQSLKCFNVSMSASESFRSQGIAIRIRPVGILIDQRTFQLLRSANLSSLDYDIHEGLPRYQRKH